MQAGGQKAFQQHQQNLLAANAQNIQIMPNQKTRIHKPTLSHVPKVEQHQAMDSSGIPHGIQVDLAQTQVKKPPSGSMAAKN